MQKSVIVKNKLCKDQMRYKPYNTPILLEKQFELRNKLE